MFESVLVPLDGSALSGRALPFAKRLARAAGAPLIVVRAHLPTDDALSLRLQYPELSAAERADAEREAAETEFRSAVDELRKDGLHVESHFVEGVAADVIFETAKATRANVDNGTGGRTRRPLPRPSAQSVALASWRWCRVKHSN
jgi:nucleotide-binding universal stress UspA family protein